MSKGWNRVKPYVPDRDFNRRRRHRAATSASVPDSGADAVDDIVETVAPSGPSGDPALLIGTGTDRLLIGTGTDVLLIGS